MQMNIARRISEAIGSWLHFEFCCYRAGLFSENSLKSAVGHVLSTLPISKKGTRAYADFPHQLLNPIARQGRPRSIDFALLLTGDNLPKRNAELVAETKWAGSSHCTPENIVEDFLRLGQIKSGDPNTLCVFILAGNHRDIRKLLKEVPFIIPGKRNTGIGVSGNEKRVEPNPKRVDHRALFGPAIRSLAEAGFSLPLSFVCRSHGLHPRQTDNDTVDFQAIAWEITIADTRLLKSSAWKDDSPVRTVP